MFAKCISSSELISVAKISRIINLSYQNKLQIRYISILGHAILIYKRNFRISIIFVMQFNDKDTNEVVSALIELSEGPTTQEVQNKPGITRSLFVSKVM